MTKKNRMTPLFILAAIVAAPVVFWFVRRRAKPRAVKENTEAASATTSSGEVELETSPSEVPRPPESSVLVAEEEGAPAKLEELPSETPQPVDAAQSLDKPESNISLIQGDAAILDAAHVENNNSSVIEITEPSVMPEDDRPTEHQAAAAAVAGAEPETSQVYTTTVVLFPADNVRADETEEALARPEVKQSAELQAGPAGVQSEADICEEPDGAGTEENGPIAPSPQVSDDVPFLSPAETFAGHQETIAHDPPASGEPETQHVAAYTAMALTVSPPPEAGFAQVLSSEIGEPSEGDTGEGQHLYRPPPQRAPRQTPRPVTQSLSRSTSDLALDIRVQVRFDRFGFCEIRLLPERMAEMDNEVEVKTGGTELHLVAQEEWYQDLTFENIGDRLRRGLELKGLLADHRRARWLLTGRDIYILANQQRASGFVSTTRLVLGRSHVVLCAAELLPQVEAALKDAGCQGYTKLDQAHGIPSGWIGLRGVTPSIAVPLEPGIDAFYAVKPAPDIEIEFEGGVCLRNSIWLAGFPPRIKLLGDISAPVKVLIDGKEAVAAGDGSLVGDGYDQPGQHLVYCEGLSCSRSYSIEDPPDVWEEWPAYHFGQAEICGPRVHILPQAAGWRILSVPMSNPLLLGAEPGQIFRCSPRSVKNWKGFVPFDVVWALPAHPYICDKKTARIIQFAQTPLVLPGPKKHVLGWCAAILEASAKGLQIENASSDGTVLWKEYKKAARNLRRAAR
ncbi:MAG: hypothetical protein JWO19_2264 [Bryobacterales bacterium]|nr:hypothetical protein [Bryobacterales bacterium]